MARRKDNIVYHNMRMNLDNEQHRRIHMVLTDLNTNVHKSVNQFLIDATDEKEYKGWDKSAVERILKSDTYSGTLVQGKTSITAKNERNRIHKSEEEWVVTKDAHVPYAIIFQMRNMQMFRGELKILDKMCVLFTHWQSVMIIVVRGLERYL